MGTFFRKLGLLILHVGRALSAQIPCQGHKILIDLHKIGKYCSRKILMEDEVTEAGHFLY